MRRVVGVCAVIVGALLLGVAGFPTVLSPAVASVEPGDTAFGALLSGASLLLTGFGIWAARTALARKLLSYASALLLVPGIMGGTLFGLLRQLGPYPTPGVWRYWLGCALATLCGTLTAVSTVEPAVPLVSRLERSLAESAMQLGLLDEKRLATPSHLTRTAVVRASAACLSLFVFLSLVAWNESFGAAWSWLVAGWLIGWGTLAIHELAHALLARSLGYRVTRVSIGGFPRLPEFKLASVRFSLGLFLPSHGLVEFSSAPVPVWQAMRRVAWAGPASGALLAAVGFFVLVMVPGRSLTSQCAVVLAICGLVSLGQLFPERARIGNRVVHTDGTWLFMPEHILRQVAYLRWLSRLRISTAASSDAPSVGSPLLATWHRLSAEPVAEQRRGMVLALDALASAVPSVETHLLASFVLGCLARLSPEDEDFAAIEPLVTRFVAGEAPAIVKTRLLDVLACCVLFPPREALLLLAERWTRLALEMSPNDVTLYGTLGSVLVERGQKEEGQRMLRELLKRSTSMADRRIARRMLAV